MKHIWTKMYPCTLNILKKQGVDKDPIYTLYDWLNYNMYSEESPPGATTTAVFRNGCGSFFCKRSLFGSDNERPPPRMIGSRTMRT